MDTRLYQIAHIPPEETALSKDISDSATSFSVEDASTLPSDPSTGDFYLYVKGEFMALDATDATNDTVTVTRGALGTSPREHKAGDIVYEGEIDADGVDDRELRRIDEIANPDIKEIGEIEQNLEYEKAKFRISNCNVTINGLPKDRLQDAGSVHRPWVFEIVDDTGTVVFSGIVDGESVSFTASSRNTSFDVLSWLELLDRAGSVPARDVFEVDVYGTARSNSDSAFVDSNQDDIQIKLNNEASLVGQVAQVGDVAVIETDESEIRKQIVRRETDDDDRVVIFINAKEEGDGTDVVRKVPGAGSYSTDISTARIGQTGYSDLRVRITDDQQVFDIIEAVNGDLGSLPSGGSKTVSVPEGFSVEVDLKYKAVALNRFNNVEASDERSATVYLDEIQVYGANDDYYIEFNKGFDDTINTGPRSDTPVDEVEDQEYRVRIKRDSTQRLAEDLSSDSTVRILGQEIYGYNGLTYFDQVLYYDGQPLIKNLFQIEAATTTGRAQLGVLPQVFDAASYDSLNDFAREASIDPRVELPDDPLKALRQIQQRRQFLLKERFSNRTNSNGEAIPGYYPEFIFRDGFFDSAVEVSERKVKEWTENVSENDVRAVIVKPNEDYLKGRAGPDVEERIGFYFEGISRYENADSEDIRDRMSPPEGRNVIEIEMPIIPSEEIGFKYRGGDTVENNPKLRYVAKFFYEHFTKASREVEITFGDDTPEWIGGYWYFKNQGDVIDDYVFISQETKNVDSTSIDASLKGRIGQEAATIDDAPPTAVVKGPKEVSRANSAGDVQVVLNGDESFSLSGNPLSFTWERKKVGGTFSEVQSNGSILKDTVSGVDREVGYVYRLTVTDDQTGVTDSVTHDLTVAPNRNEAAPTPQNQSFDVKTWQQESDGVLEVIPNQFNSLDKVEKRSEVGGNIDKGAAFSEVSRFQVDIASIDTTNDEIVLTGDYEEHFQKPFLYAKEDDAGGTTLFDISKATYDSGANETTISLAESIDSTRFDAVETGTFVMRVALSTKHTSAIEIRTTGAVDGTRQTQTHTFDFDNLAEVDASVYNDESGAVYADVRGDEDTDNFDLEYRKNGGNWQSDLTGQTNSIVGYEVLSGDQVSDGDQIEVRITPFNAEGEQGRQIVRATFYNRSTDGSAQFDGIIINGAGTIDSVNTGEFRFRDPNGDDAAKIDVFNVELEQINGVAVGNYARTDQDETFTGDVTIQNNLYVQGTETITNTETLDIATNMGVLNAGETNAGVTKGYAGYEVDRGTLSPFRWIFDEGGDRFRIGQWHKTINHGSVTNGPFQEGEVIVGQTSGSEAYIWNVGSGAVDVKRRTGAFDVAGGETIEGQTSGATASITGQIITDDTQAVATREDSPTSNAIPVWDSTNKKFVSSALTESGGIVTQNYGDFTVKYGRGDNGDSRLFEIEMVDSGGSDDTIRWIRNAGVTPDEAFTVRNQSVGQNNFLVEADGKVRVPSGDLAINSTIRRNNDYDIISAASGGNVFYKGGGGTIQFEPVDGTKAATINNNNIFSVFNPANSPTGSFAQVASPAGDLGVIFEVGDGSGGVAHRWDVRYRPGSVDLLYDNNNSHEVLSYNESDHLLWMQPKSSGGQTEFRFKSQVNSGSDFGYLRWYDDNDRYDEGGTGNERGVMMVGAQNDDPGGGIGDHVVLHSAGSIWLDADEDGQGGSVYMKTGDILSDNYTSGWTGSDNKFPRSGRAEMDALSVRGTLLVRELEIRKLRYSKGPRIDGVGGGKIESIPVGPSNDSNGNYRWRLKFEEPHGCQSGDYLLTQETDPGFDQERSDGTKGGIAVVKQVRGRVFSVPNTKEVIVYARTSGSGNVSETTYKNAGYSEPEIGDDVIVAASENGNRDSMIFYDPYGPFIDILDGISNFGEWDSRSPSLRMGWLDGGVFNRNGEYGIGAGDASGSGDYFVATPSTVEVHGGIFAEFGNIAGWNINSSYFGRDTASYTLALGNVQDQFGYGAAHPGLEIRPDSSKKFIRLVHHPDGGSEMITYENGNNYVSLAAGSTWKQSETGIKVVAGGDKVLHTTIGAAELAGWEITDSFIRDSADYNVNLRSDRTSFEARANGANVYVGQIYSAGWTGRYGLYMSDSNNNGVFEFSAENKYIADWTFTTNRLENTSFTGDNKIELGKQTWTGSRYGLGVFDTSSDEAVFLGSNGTPHILVDKSFGQNNNNNYVSIGAAHYRSNFGITVRASGKTVIETQPTDQANWDYNNIYLNSAYIDDRATLSNGVKVGYTSAADLEDTISAAGDRSISEGMGRQLENGIIVRASRKSAANAGANANSQENMINLHRTARYHSTHEVDYLDWGEPGQTDADFEIGVPSDNYVSESFFWFYFDETGTWDVAIDSDDDSELFIDGERVDYWLDGGRGRDATEAQNNAGTFNVPSVGYYRVYVRHEEATGGSGVRWFLKAPSDSSFYTPTDSSFYKRRKTAGDGRVTIQDGTITATEINTQDLFSVNAQVTGTLTIGDGSTGAVQSYNYDGSQGWQIKGDTATFENGNFRGNVDAEGGTLADLQVQGQLTFPSNYDSSQIRIGSGSNAFFVGDFSLFGSGQGSDSPQIQDSLTNSVPGTTQTTSTTDSYNEASVGGTSVTVDVDWDSSSTTSGSGIDRTIDPNTQVEVEIVVEELDAGTVSTTRTKSAGYINQSGNISFSFTANSSTDEIRVTTNLTAQIGDDEEYYDSVTISNDDAFIDWTNQQDFVGPDGAIWRDNGETRVKIDGGFASGATDDRIVVQEGRVTIRDQNGNDVISIQSNGLIVFHQKRNHPDQAAMDYGQGSIYAYDAGGGNVNLGWTEDSGNSASTF